jgi:hypothetical protein
MTGSRSYGCGAANARIDDPPKPLTTEPVRSLDTTVTWRERIRAWGVRWRIGRSNYALEPGLYQIGQPAPTSPVLVTANYKLSVDTVRKHLKRLDVWLLVLDTKGVNVWCAAGKGSFGTAELIRRIEATGLTSRVIHRRIVVPQLGAVGVAAHEVARATGFSVRYGPVLARDIPAYLAAGMKATPAMRLVPFGWRERIVVVPVEVVGAWKLLLAVLLFAATLGVIRGAGISWRLLSDALPLLGALLTGVLVVPLLLPWLPFRAFALKGVVAGALWAAASLYLLPMNWREAAGTVMLELAITTFLAMTFTGSTTFTNEAGARLEVRRALPAVVVAATLGIVLRLIAAIA